MFQNKNIAVLDTTHGGAIIAIKLASSPVISPASVTAVDIYNTTSTDTIQKLQDSGVTYQKADSIENIPDFILSSDIIIAPVHMPPAHPLLKEAEKTGTTIVTHHKAVGKIVQITCKNNYNLDNTTIIEITGTKAKTTTASLLSEILSSKFSVVVHTSRGLEYLEADTTRLLQKGLSITPANVLTALDIMENTLPALPDVLIFEESLGGCGIADIGIITTTTLDYDIAGGSKKASIAKAQIIQNAKKGSTVLINSDSIDLLNLIDACAPAPISAYLNKFKLLTFCDNESVNGNGSIKSRNCDFTIRSNENSAAPDSTESEYIIQSVSGMYKPVIFEPSGGYEFNSYKTGMVASAACAMQLAITSSVISKILSAFSGLTGRMQVIEQNERIVVDNSNSGMDVASTKRAIEIAKTLPQTSDTKTLLVFGEDAETVCEGLDIPAAADLLVTWPDADVITVGKRIRTLKNMAKHAKNLNDAITIANTVTRKDDIILSCVKCFR